MSTPAVKQEPYIWKDGVSYEKESGYFTIEKYYSSDQIYMTCSMSTGLASKDYFVDFIDDWYRIDHFNIIPLEDAWYNTKKYTMGWVTKKYTKLFDKYSDITLTPKELKHKWCAQLLDALKYLNAITKWKVQNLCFNFIYLDTKNNIKLGGLAIFYKNIYNKIPNINFITDFTISKRLLSYTHRTYIWVWAYLTIGILAGEFCYSTKRKKDIMLLIRNDILPEEVERVRDINIRCFLKKCLLDTFKPNMEKVYRIFES